MTRLCDAFSKKLDNHRAALALHFAFYNFVRPHESLKTTPAVAAKLLPHPLSIGELLDLALAEEPSPAPVAQRLEPRPGTGAARELPGRRGGLRIVGGSRGVAPASTAPSTTPPAEPVQLVAAPPSTEARQGDLFEWLAAQPAKPLPPRGEQLSFFPEGER